MSIFGELSFDKNLFHFID